MKQKHYDGITMAIAPTTRGLGYVVFERRDVIMDWGVKEVRKSKLRDCVLKARVLIDMLQPSVVVLEDAQAASSLRSHRTTVLLNRIAELAERRGITVMQYAREEVLDVFGRTGARNKDDVAAAVAKLVPELAPRLPPRRRIWESEHYAMAIFEAAALAITHFASD